ncbi:MAG: hypothetical protein RL417_466 [Pseudomonadota bacterium]
MKPCVLFIDDDRAALDSLVRAVAQAGLGAVYLTAQGVADALAQRDRNHPLVIVLDLSLVPESGVESGFELLRTLAGRAPPARIIVLTGHGDELNGVRALHLGASSFLQKPADIPHLAALIRDGLTQAAILRRSVEPRPSSEEMGLIGESAAMRGVLSEIRTAAQTTQPILLIGETGTGKGLSARAIHLCSARGRGNLVRYQPTFATPDIVQSDLFGHLKGAFTGASTDRRGLIAEADGGTLFLDEIDELPPEIQIALLGVLQDKRFRPVGSSSEVSSNFRLITASNRPLEEALELGKLRPDLMHRIAHTVIRLPPLRERLDDIPLLVAHLIARLAAREKLDILGVDDAVLELLTKHRWPGNVRELEGVVESAAYRAKFAGRERITPADLRFLSAYQPTAAVERDFHSQVEAFKGALIDAALERHGGNQLRAAHDLGVDRGTLARILKTRPKNR